MLSWVNLKDKAKDKAMLNASYGQWAAIEPSNDQARTELSRERLRHFRALRVYKKKRFTHSEMAQAGYAWMDVEVRDVETVRGWARECLDHGVYSTARYGTRYYFAYPEDLTMFKLRWG